MKSNIVSIQTTILLVISLAGLSLTAQPENTPPNIVIILSDDQGWTDYGFMGHPVIETPHLDRLAASSLVFERGYVAVPLCRPSLGSMVTGLFPSQHGVVGNDVDGSNNRAALDIPLRELFHQHPSFVRMLTDNGYLAHQSGKWWEGSYQDGGFTHGMTHGDPARGGRHGDDGLAIGREGMEPIAEFLDHAVAEDKPFLVWYAPFLPHTPHNPPKRLLQKYLAEGREMDVAKYYAMCEWFDETCGELLELLEERGLTDNTLILYICDNGIQPVTTNIEDPDQKLWNQYALRTKGSPYDMGIRTPIMVSLPGKMQPASSPYFAHAIDFFPTIAAAAGLTPPPGLPGINLLDAEAVAARERIFAESHSSHNITIGNPDDTLQYLVVVEDEWKLLLRKSGKDTTQFRALHSWDTPPARLYRIKEDPFEKNDLAEQHPEEVQRLTQEIKAWQQDIAVSKAPMAWRTVYPGHNPGEWFPRPLPLTELPITRTINAADFGAIPDDGQCDVKAIAAAIEALRDAPGTKLVFAPGTYDLITGHDSSGEFDPNIYDSALDKAVFELINLRDVQIDFGGSLMLAARPQATFMMVYGCENVIVENFKLDYVTQPYTMGTIVAIDTVPGEIAFDFQILDDYLSPNSRFFLDYLEDPARTDQPTTRTWGYVIDPRHPGRVKAGTQNVFFPSVLSICATGFTDIMLPRQIRLEGRL